MFYVKGQPQRLEEIGNEVWVFLSPLGAYWSGSYAPVHIDKEKERKQMMTRVKLPPHFRLDHRQRKS
jgi:hypothetical protein